MVSAAFVGPSLSEFRLNILFQKVFLEPQPEASSVHLSSESRGDRPVGGGFVQSGGVGEDPGRSEEPTSLGWPPVVRLLRG